MNQKKIHHSPFTIHHLMKFPLTGSFEDLPDLIRELEIQEVIITDHKIPSEKLFEAMMQLGRRRKVEFRLAPSLFNFLPQKTSVEQIGILPMVVFSANRSRTPKDSSNALQIL